MFVGNLESLSLLLPFGLDEIFLTVWKGFDLFQSLNRNFQEHLLLANLLLVISRYSIWVMNYINVEDSPWASFDVSLSLGKLTWATKTPMTAVANSGAEDPAAMKVAPATSGGMLRTRKYDDNQ